MSTSAVQTAFPEWKQEVNRRLAEHKGRKSAPQSRPQGAAEAPSASRRAQEAVARVAARYAQAPSYSEVLAAEARAALRAAEAAQQAALQATAAVQTILAGFESGFEPAELERTIEPQRHEPALAWPMQVEQIESAPEPAGLAIPTEARAEETEAELPALNWPPEPVSVRWAQELPARPAEPAQFHTSRGEGMFEEEWWRASSVQPLAAGAEMEMVEPALPIAGNIIEFPRELVAARKARPRLAEAPAAALENGAQLSIFEVDPSLLPADPAVDAEQAAQLWSAPTWSGIELDEQPAVEAEHLVLRESFAEALPAPELGTAPVSRRLMAGMVDAALVCGGVLAGAIASLHNGHAVPGLHAAEAGLGAALLIAATLYFGLFFALSSATPGMRYARVQLSTLEGQVPTRGQRCSRAFAMLLAVLPLGLGVLWFLFDDENLCWHDRLSRTYLREA